MLALFSFRVQGFVFALVRQCLVFVLFSLVVFIARVCFRCSCSSSLDCVFVFARCRNDVLVLLNAFLRSVIRFGLSLKVISFSVFCFSLFV